MQQTSNYKLNQWDLTDPILMSDFNADNAKLEAALKDLDERAGSRTGWPGMTLPGLSTNLLIHTEYLQWDQLSTALVIMVPIVSNGKEPTLYANKDSFSLSDRIPIDTVPVNSSADDLRQAAQIVLFPMFESRQKVKMLLLGTNSPGIKTLDFPYSSLHGFTLSFSAEERDLQPGSFVRLYIQK